MSLSQEAQIYHSIRKESRPPPPPFLLEYGTYLYSLLYMYIQQ